MCDFKVWLCSKYFSKNIYNKDYEYWCDRMTQAYWEGEFQTIVTILQDCRDGIIMLSPADQEIVESNYEDYRGGKK